MGSSPAFFVICILHSLIAIQFFMYSWLCGGFTLKGRWRISLGIGSGRPLETSVGLVLGFLSCLFLERESWYYGTVNDYDKSKKLHHIKYDDRDKEWINLQTKRFELLLPPSEVPRNAGRNRSAMKKKSSSENATCCKDAQGLTLQGVFKLTQKLYDFLGVQVAAIDFFIAACIQELANFSENLLLKSQPQLVNDPSHVEKVDIDSSELIMKVTKSHQFDVRLLQFLALIYLAMILVFPAYLLITTYLGFIQNWWALCKMPKISSKVLAAYLRGTIFLKYCFEMLGARIGYTVLLDAVDITNPSLVSIGDEAGIAEGVSLQRHEVKNGLCAAETTTILVKPIAGIHLQK
ncbi:hypothetical protein K1719_010033 [Acacia pycnantha]|nr:hypothetical protein K1719_010033 [Acacia pycnantha]